jgi:hypothetical protein
MNTQPTVNVRRTRDRFPLLTKTKTVSQAFYQFVCCELAFGGRITEVTEDKVAIRTTVLGSVDETEITGSQEQMRIFVQAAEATRVVDSLWGSSPQVKVDLPSHLQLPAIKETAQAIIAGSPRCKKVLLTVIVKNNPEAVLLLPQLARVDVKHLSCLTSMVVDEGYALEDALACAL